MKRLVLWLLLIVLPLQATWAAGVGHCPPDGGHAHAPLPHDHSHPAHAHAQDDGEWGPIHHSPAAHEHDHDDGDDGGVQGHAAGPGLDCSAFHFVALEPFAAPAHALPQAGMTAHDAGCAAYESHIPDGPDRPRWRIAV